MNKKWMLLAIVFLSACGQVDQAEVPTDMAANVVKDVSSSSSSSAVSSVAVQEEPSEPPAPSGVVVTVVTDGDTIKVQLGDGTEESVRIIGIDTPEVRPMQCFGEEASSRMQMLVEGQIVELERDPAGDRDNFGRLLRYISVNGKDIGARMINDGYAHSYTKYPHPRMEHYNVLERDARSAKRGLWGDVCKEPDVEPTEEVVQEDPPTQPPPPSGNTNPFQEQPPPPPEQECVIKGNVNSEGEKIYHYPGCRSYKVTKIKPEEGDQWFCTQEQARAAGFRMAGNC